MNRFVGFLALLAALGACDLTEQRSLFQRAAQLRAATTDSVVFVTPDTIAINTAFNVTVVTYGGGCDRKGPETLVTVGTDSVEFRPFDIFESHGEVCSTELQEFEHAAAVTFTSSGTKSVTVFGRDANSAPLQRTRYVLVTP